MMKSDYIPKYIKIKNNLKKRISRGEFTPGSRLPTENELTEEFNVSRHTVRKALDLLNREGYLQKKQGVGTFFKKNSKRKTKNVGFISISVHDYIFSDILQGTDDVLHEEGYQILLGNSRDSQDREREILNNFLEKKIDGLIIEPAQSAANYNNGKLLQQFSEQGIPVIVLDSKLGLEKLNYISINDKRGGYLAAEYFISKGHENIAIIYKALHKPSLDRFKGFRKALVEHNISTKKEYCKEYYNSEFEKTEEFKEEVGVLTKNLIDMDKRPTGIFCFNDQVAILVKEVIEEMGLNVPDDISLIGFDNSKLVNLNTISITSIDHPKKNAGEKAARIFLDNRESANNIFYENIIYEPRLVERESVKKI